MTQKQYDPFKTYLTRPVRLAVMFSLISLFFVISPLILFYTQGWRWNFTTWQPEATGVLSIDTLPDDATVFLNNTVIGTTQPLRMASLAPGVYQVKISKPGFYEFTTDVTVRSHETSYIRNTTLFTTTVPLLVTSTPSTSTQLKIISAEPLAYHYLQTKTTSTLFSVVTDNQINSFPIPANKQLICAKTKNYCVIFENKTGAIQIIDSNNPQNTKALVIPRLKNLAFNEADSRPLLYAEADTKILGLETNAQVATVALTSSSIWFAETNKIWMFSSSTLRTDTSAVTVPAEVENIITVQDSFSILKTKDGLSIVSGLPNNPIVNTLSGYTHTDYHSATNEWRLWSPWEISSVYGQGERAILYRSAEPIQFVKALEPAGVLLIVQNNSLIAFNPGYYSSQKLASFEKITDLTTDEENRLILIAGSYEGKTGIFSLAY